MSFSRPSVLPPMTRPTDCTIGPTTTGTAQAVPDCRAFQLLPHSTLTSVRSREENEDNFWQKAVLSSPTTGMSPLGNAPNHTPH